MLIKFSNKCTRDNLDKSVEFIFDNSEEMIEAKTLRNEELCLSENHKLTGKTSLIAKRFNLEYKQRCYKVILSKKLFVILLFFVSWVEE